MSEAEKVENTEKHKTLTGVFRPAILKDAKRMHKLINMYADKGEMLPRSLNEIYETIRQYAVYEEDGIIVGACGLSISWEDLAEIRALSVDHEHMGRGIGKELVNMVIKEAKRLGVKRVFSLTYVPKFFLKMGFHDIDKNELPHKIWSDCLKCHKFPDCDESSLALDIS